MTRKKYRIETTCPKCGCSAVNHLSSDEIKDKFGNVPNVDMECHECLLQYSTPMETACPEWDKECRLKGQ